MMLLAFVGGAGRKPKKKDQAGFDPRADVNNDGAADIRDLGFVSRQLPVGTNCP
jgi:hypothetical protein